MNEVSLYIPHDVDPGIPEQADPQFRTMLTPFKSSFWKFIERLVYFIPMSFRHMLTRLPDLNKCHSGAC
jgi:hypothetical protein